MSGTDLEPVDTGIELVQFTDAKQFAELLSGLAKAAEPTEEEMEAMRFTIVYEMAAAGTEADLWREMETWSSKDVIDRAFEIKDARAWRSKFTTESGKAGAFLSCPAVDLETGELGILNTSAMRLCGRIGWYKIHGLLPVQLRIVKVTETARGFPVLDGRLLQPLADSQAPVDEPEVIEDAELVDEHEAA